MREGIHYLRVKVKSLDEEIRIIRKEMRKLRSSVNFLKEKTAVAETAVLKTDLESLLDDRRWVFQSLRNHMDGVVKTEFRSTLLAMAFVKGKPYSTVEKYCRNQPNWARVEVISKKYAATRCPDGYAKAAQASQIALEWQVWYQAARDHIFVSGGGYADLHESLVTSDRERRALELEATKAEIAVLEEKHGLKFPLWAHHYRDPQVLSVFRHLNKIELRLARHMWTAPKKEEAEPRKKILGVL